MKKVTLILAVVALMFSTNLFAQNNDVKGSKDYPLIQRFPGSDLKFYKVFKWQEYNVPLTKLTYKEDRGRYFPHMLKTEGRLIRYQYTTPAENNPAYLYKTLLDNLKKNGFTILVKGKGIDGIGCNSEDFCNYYYGNKMTGQFGLEYYPRGEDTHCFIVARKPGAEKNIYTVIYISGFSDKTLITQDVMEADREDILNAHNIDENLATYGHISIYSILFDPGKADIKPESDETLKVIAGYLKNHPDKKFVIVGHTDNTGDFDANIKLSMERAQAVVNELISKYSVKAEQLKAYGVGQAAPVATNSTDEGRAKNRRVEIVKL